ncbi:MAG: MFS transporter [Candidatus Thermoplasmatota archaeon]|nr:MFS transporter [Candidatus Thermoplasmatota archaeon]MCL6014914.1 MFS transporter [Candidatus Thermoplasmatota archaeon]
MTRFIRAFGRGSTFIFLPLIFIIVYHISFIITGLFLGSATLLMAFVQYYSGILTDRIGRRTILVYSQIPAVVFYLLIYYTVANPYYFVLLLGSWYGTIIINSIQYPAVQASVADITSVRDRLSGYTIMRIMANLGIAIGPLLGAYLAYFGLQYIFLVSSAVTVVEIFMLYFLMRETYVPSDHIQVMKGELSRTYMKDRFFVVFIIIGVLLQIFMRQRGSTFTVYTIVLQNLPYMYLGYIWALNGILVVTLQFPLLRLMTKVGNPMMWRGVGTLFYAISFLVLTDSTAFLILALFMTISTFGEDLLSPTTQSIITTLAPDNMRGSYVGVYNLYSSFGGFAGAIIGLYLLFVLQSVSSTYWFYIAIGTVVVAVMYMFISGMFSRRMKEMEETVISSNVG